MTMDRASWPREACQANLPRLSGVALMRTRLVRSLACAAVGAVVVPLAVGAGPAGAATNKYGGQASSTASVLALRVQALSQPAHTVEAVRATLSASTLASPFAASIS